MEKYGIMQHFSAGSKEMQVVDAKQRIYLEWPTQYTVI